MAGRGKKYKWCITNKCGKKMHFIRTGLKTGYYYCDVCKTKVSRQEFAEYTNDKKII
jgi:hypothetical protein